MSAGEWRYTSMLGHRVCFIRWEFPKLHGTKCFLYNQEDIVCKKLRLLYFGFFILSCFLVIPFIGCDDDDDDNDTDEVYIMPLEVGYRWAYVADAYDGSHLEFQWRVMATRDINGEEVYQVGLYDPAVSSTWLLKNHPDGLYGYGADGEFFETPCLNWKYPCACGESYLSCEGITCEIPAMADPITVPAGEFTCIRYCFKSPDYPSLRFDEYAAPGLGMVKRDIYDGETWLASAQLTGYDFSSSSSMKGSGYVNMPEDNRFRPFIHFLKKPF
jgi:hypothetical protein